MNTTKPPSIPEPFLGFFSDNTMTASRRKLLVVLVILGLPILLLLVAAFGGHALPAVQEGRVVREIAASPERVFALLEDPERAPVSGTAAASVEKLEPESGQVRWRENLGSSTITVTIAEKEAPRRLVRTLADAVVPMTGRHEVRLEPAGAGTKVTVDYRYEVGSSGLGPMFRLLLWMGGAERGVSEHLEVLSQAAAK